MKFLLKLGGVVGLTLIAASATAASPVFEYVRTVDYTPHCCLGNPMAMATAPNGTSLYLGDWFDDDIYYVASPLSTDGTNNDIVNTLEIQDTAGTWAAGGWSYQGADLDGPKLYIGGANGTDTQLFSVVENSPGAWTTTQITGITGIYSGPTVVGPDSLVLPNYETGGLQFFSASASSVTPNGAEIPNPNTGTAKTLSAMYDQISGKIFTYMVADNLTRRIDIFNSNGTPSGTTYQGTWVAGASSTLLAVGGTIATSHNRDAQITINDEHRILIAPFRDGVSEGWDVFNISTVGASGVPYKQIRAADLNTEGYTGTGRNMTGSAVFSAGNIDYLALNFWNKMAIFAIAPVSNISDWTLY